MDKPGWQGRLSEGVARLGLPPLDSSAAAQMERLADELLRWNQRVNLTAITDPDEVAEKHFLDSLAVMPELGGARTVLDLGAGAGFPGLPLKLYRPELALTLVDAVAKKVGFLKHAIALLGQAPSARALHARAEGHPDREGLPRVELALSRALMDLEPWLLLARHYLLPGGRVVAMMGKSPGEARAQAACATAGLEWLGLRTYALPFSGVERAVVQARLAP